METMPKTRTLAVLLVGALAAAVAEAPCRVSGTVIESAAGKLVIESQNERIRFTQSHGLSAEMQGLKRGDRVTIVFDPARENPGTIREIIVAPKDAPGEAPASPLILDDRAFYEASREILAARARVV